MSVGVCIKCGEVLECEQCNPQSQSNSQLLKAEISEMLPQWKHCCELGVDWYEVDMSHVERLRQLSAV
jgi:hypothetical protein